MDGTVKKHEIIAKAEEMSSLKVVMEDADLVVGMEMYKVGIQPTPKPGEETSGVWKDC